MLRHSAGACQSARPTAQEKIGALDDERRHLNYRYAANQISGMTIALPAAAAHAFVA
jgi:hypothetical protein